MKMVMIFYNTVINDEVMEALEKYCEGGFSRWTKVLGRGEHSGSHFDNDVWPGSNSCCMACVSDEAAAKIMNRVRELRGEFAQEGIKAFTLPVDDVT